MPCRRQPLPPFVAAVAACLICHLAGAQGPQPDQRPGPKNSSPPATGLAAIRQPAPEFLVRAEVNHTTGQYREGDTFNVRVVSEVDAYVYVLYQQADGKTFQVFPNALQTRNRLRARQTVQIPGSDDDFRWEIGPPFGMELVKVIASKEPIENLASVVPREKVFNPVTDERLKGVGHELGVEQAPPWTEVDRPIITAPRNQAVDVSRKRRFGVFFGVADYKFNSEVEAIDGDGMNLACPHRDARELDETLREIGELNDTRVFTNREATRNNLEMAIVSWLPQVSRPGDTVFIYFSGHGGTMDGSPRKTHYLVPHDFLSMTAFAGMMKKREEGTLKPEYANLVATLEQVVRQSGSITKADDLLTRKTGVTDAEFGHWLQKLDGRQLIVVLDVCFAGGFAMREKNLAPPDPKEFRFLQDQMVQLKDIGQPETALLAASRADQTSQVRQEQDLSVMTYALLTTLRKAAGPVTLDQAYQGCVHDMEQYFSSHGIAGHEPKLFNYCSRPVFLKP